MLIFRKIPKDTPDREVLLFAGKVRINANKRMTVENQILTLSNVARSDSGTYVCIYQVGDKDVTVSHIVDVYYPPTIKRKQKKIDVIKGEDVELECRGSGNPEPKITWTKMEGAMPSGSQSEEGISIIFEGVDRHVSGSYDCIADNGVGEPATAKREVVVSYKPEIRTENVRSRLNASHLLSLCIPVLRGGI